MTFALRWVRRQRVYFAGKFLLFHLGNSPYVLVVTRACRWVFMGKNFINVVQLYESSLIVAA